MRSELYLLIGSIPLFWSTEKLCRSRNYVNFLDGGWGEGNKKVSLVFAFVDGDGDIHVSAGALRGVG